VFSSLNFLKLTYGFLAIKKFTRDFAPGSVGEEEEVGTIEGGWRRERRGK